MLIVDDNNFQMVVDEAAARTGGELLGVEPRRTVYGSSEAIEYGLIVGEEALKPFPESEWVERINAFKGRFVGDRMVDANLPCKDQNGLGYCWTYSLTSCVEAVRLADGFQHVELNPESLGGDVGWRNRGNSLDSAIKYAREHGICERRFSRPHDLNYRGWEAGWQDNALNYRPQEWFDLDGPQRWQLTVTALLCGLSVYVGLDYWSHAIIYCGLVVIDNEVCPVFRNSWGPKFGDNGYAVLKGKKKYPSLGCFAPRAVSFAG